MFLRTDASLPYIHLILKSNLYVIAVVRIVQNERKSTNLQLLSVVIFHPADCRSYLLLTPSENNEFAWLHTFLLSSFPDLPSSKTSTWPSLTFPVLLGSLSYLLT